jgi:gliding motility-associated-like protein
VQATNPTQGKNKIQWLPPTQIDTAQYPAPYTLEIYRTPALDANTTTRTSIANYFYTDFYKIKPDFLIDSNINTQNNPNSYQIEFYYGANTQKVGIAKSSSTPYLTATPASTQIKLTWNYNTAWTNDTFVVYKKNAANNFDSLTTIINKNTYTDTDLTNGTNYCYYIKTKGNLNLTDTDKLYTQNLSQQTCATPIDQEPPPPPTLTITPNCNDIQNILTWTTTASPDLASFTIYYKPNLSAAFGIIASGLSPTDRSFAHTLTAQNSVVGCYILIAIDSTGNPSAAVDTVCIEECADNYKLPDIFTPNNDNINDVFVPFDGYKFVKNVDFVVYNRWGQPLYATQNPAINWTGNNTPAGIYYYKCLITINALSGTKQRQLTGNIKIVR